MTEKIFAFVLMPFEKAFGDTYFLGIKSTAETAGMIAERVDEQVFHREGILERIHNQIEAADLIIADMTGRNPNVFYEVGYAHAKGKLCVLLTKDANDIPFDLKHQRHIVYTSIQDLKNQLSNDLMVVKGELEAREQPIMIELKSISGYLEKSKYLATAEVTMCMDMHNRTNMISPDIYGIYFYTGKGWDFKQDGQECLQSDADSNSQGFKIRHLIRAPMPRLTKGGWAQIKLVGKKMVATAFKGEELKDAYELTGVALLRVSTAKGDFDTLINLKVTADEIPF
jgi:nucleoside 2-deoxyribosyltransferase